MKSITEILQDCFENPLEAESICKSGDGMQPFESPIEEELHLHLAKYLRADTKVSNQVEFRTPNGNYRVDFLLQRDDSKVVIEANGKAFHSFITDIYRGAFILGFTDVQSVYYVRGCDIAYSSQTVLYAISQYEPYLFSERGIKSLDALSEVKEGRGEIHYCENLCRQDGLRSDRAESNEHPVVYSLTLLRKRGQHDKWLRIYRAALESPGITAKDFDATFIRSPHYFVN